MVWIVDSHHSSHLKEGCIFAILTLFFLLLFFQKHISHLKISEIRKGEKIDSSNKLKKAVSQFGIIEWIYFFFLVIFLIGRCSRLKVTCFSNQSACSGTMNKWAIKLNVQNTDGSEYCAMIIDISFKMKEKSNNRRQNVQGDHFIPRPTLLFHLSMMQRRTHCVRLEVNASKWKFRTAKRMLINRTLLARALHFITETALWPQHQQDCTAHTWLQVMQLRPYCIHFRTRSKMMSTWSSWLLLGWHLKSTKLDFFQLDILFANKNWVFKGHDSKWQSLW